MLTKTAETYREKMAFLGSLLSVAATGSGGGGGGRSVPIMDKGIQPKLDLLTGGIIGGSILNLDELSEPIMGTYGYRANRAIHDGLSGLLTRVQADEAAAERAVTNAVDAGTSALVDLATKAFSGAKETLVDSPRRQALLAKLRKEDDIIKQAPMKKVLESYHSMARFAPSLSTDLNATKSFLREAVQHEGGLDFMSIKGLAEAETAVTGRFKKKGK
jgi:hypothetical protein